MRLTGRALALACHNPPALIWFEGDDMRRRCLTDDCNPDCWGCQATREPPTGVAVFQFTPRLLDADQA